ncbi:MAG: hypothetical protein C0518_12015 [Opitutus sp.]|nr:hypothetical protein [Opitutus sp.]
MNARFLALLSLAAVAASAADVPPVIAPNKRAESLEHAKAVLAPKDAAAPQGLKDPFHSEAFAGAASTSGVAAPANPGASSGAPGGAVTRPAGPRSARDLIAAIAEGLKPSGFLVFRGDPTLNFGQKRVKAGDSLTITFEGTEYTVVITAIKAPNFTIRLGNEEFTRPIK